jgi:hypothetical protein
MAKQPLTANSLAWKKLVILHQGRHPHRDGERVASEVRDFLRRARRLPVDARAPEEGGLEGLTTDNAVDAFLLVIRNTTDMTRLYREETER